MTAPAVAQNPNPPDPGSIAIPKALGVAFTGPGLPTVVMRRSTGSSAAEHLHQDRRQPLPAAPTVSGWHMSITLLALLIVTFSFAWGTSVGLVAERLHKARALASRGERRHRSF